RSRRIPFGEVRDVDHGLEYLLDGFVYDLDAFAYSHAVPWSCANGPGSFGKHRSEWPGIEDGANLGNLLALDLIPFANKCGPGRCLGYHVVQDAYIVAISEKLFHIDSLNEGMQFLQGLEIWLGAMKSVDGALEQ